MSDSEEEVFICSSESRQQDFFYNIADSLKLSPYNVSESARVLLDNVGIPVTPIPDKGHIRVILNAKGIKKVGRKTKWFWKDKGRAEYLIPVEIMTPPLMWLFEVAEKILPDENMLSYVIYGMFMGYQEGKELEIAMIISENIEVDLYFWHNLIISLNATFYNYRLRTNVAKKYSSDSTNVRKTFKMTLSNKVKT